MTKWTELIGRSVGVIIDADTAMADWTPSHAGRLKKVRVVVGGIAATTVVYNGYIRLASSGFGGVDMYALFNGIGTHAAVLPVGMLAVCDSECDLAVTQTPIRVYYYHNVLPTTPEITVFGEIEV